MGQKVSPISMRLNINKTWDISSCFRRRADYVSNLRNEIKASDSIKKTFAFAGVSRVLIKRHATKLAIDVFVQKYGAAVGKKGADIAKAKKIAQDIFSLQSNEVFINILDVKRPDIDAPLVAANIAHQIEKKGFV